jgi:hypothetical protein
MFTQNFYVFVLVVAIVSLFTPANADSQCLTQLEQSTANCKGSSGCTISFTEDFCSLCNQEMNVCWDVDSLSSFFKTGNIPTNTNNQWLACTDKGDLYDAIFVKVETCRKWPATLLIALASGALFVFTMLLCFCCGCISCCCCYTRASDKSINTIYYVPITDHPQQINRSQYPNQYTPNQYTSNNNGFNQPLVSAR